jgi:pimeloyl-ACP methyl ester carboxylesterase
VLPGGILGGVSSVVKGEGFGPGAGEEGSVRVEIAGCGIEVVDGGTGLPLVVLHGFPLSSAMWREIRPALEGVCRFVTPDLRGFGVSDKPEGDYSMVGLARDVADLVDHIGLERYVLGGHSMGGYVALRLAALHRDRIAGLLLLGSRAAADSDEARAHRAAAVLSIAATGPVPYIAGFVPGLVGESSRRHRPGLLGELFAICSPTPQHVLVGCQEGMASRPDSTDLIRSLDTPVLVLVGEEDGFITVAAADSLALSLRRGNLATIPAAGHTPSMEQPKATAEAIISFLQATGLER